MIDPANRVELQVLRTAEIPTPVGYVFRRGRGLPGRLYAGLAPMGDTLLSPCLAFVVRHPRQGTFLIDTGMHRDASANRRQDFGAAMNLFFRGLKPASEAFDEQLRSAGIEPAEVARVVMTHLHVDHTSGMRLLPHAYFTINRAEWKAAHGRLASARGYAGQHLPPRDRVELVDLRADGQPHGPFRRTLDLFGDGSVRLLSTPGHTLGHQSVLLETDTGPVLIVGDAAYTRRSIEEEILPMISADDDASVASLRQLRAFAAEHPEAVVVPTHDPDAWRQLRELDTQLTQTA